MSQNFGLKWTPLLALGLSCAGPSRSTQESGHSGVSSSCMVTKLISAGQEPKADLRFKVSRGDKQYCTLTTNFERRTSFSLGFPLPRQGHVLQKLTLLATVTEIAASGDVSFEVSIVKAELIPRKSGDPRIEQRVQQIADSFIGLAASFVISSRGTLKSYTDIVKEGLDPLVKQAIVGTDDVFPVIAIPFPEAPIGVGAKWSVTRQFTLRGVEMTSVAVYELTKLENGTGTVKVTVEQNGRPGDVEVEGRPDAKQRVIKMTMTSTGTHVFSLTKILPTTGVLSSATEADLEVELVPGEKQVMHIATKTTGELTETTAPVNPITSGQTTSRSGAITSGCNLPSPNRDFVMVSTSGSHVLGLRKDGAMVAFQGWNRFGECSVPEPNRDFVAITTGSNCSFGLKKDGSIVAWGRCPPPFPRDR